MVRTAVFAHQDIKETAWIVVTSMNVPKTVLTAVKTRTVWTHKGLINVNATKVSSRTEIPVNPTTTVCQAWIVPQTQIVQNWTDPSSASVKVDSLETVIIAQVFFNGARLAMRTCFPRASISFSLVTLPWSLRAGTPPSKDWGNVTKFDAHTLFKWKGCWSLRAILDWESLTPNQRITTAN